MKNILTLVLAFSCVFSYGQKVTGDYEKTTDFSKYKTYQFVGWQGVATGTVSENPKREKKNS